MDNIHNLPAGWRYVLVVRTPSTDPEQLAALRDYVLESLPSGGRRPRRWRKWGE